jgi:predicted PurR-regulated permease PerM
MPVKFISSSGMADVAHGSMIAGLIVLFLYVAGPIVEPLVIAGLLSFILAPVMRRLRLWGLPKVVTAISCVALTLSIIGLLGATLGLQVRQLAEQLPSYENNLRAKIQLLGGKPLASGVLERVSGTLRDLQDELSRAEKGSTESSATQPVSPQPLPVEIRQPEPKGLEAIGNLVRPLLSPLATSALVILFLLFILLQREDIRDRFLRLAGTADLQRSTAALDDAASRLGRFFMMQLLLNTGFGIFIAIVLTIIGVPNAILWGILAGVMRFVPFIGSLIAGFFPAVVAAAADPGWSMPLMTLALFVVAEPAASEIVEPLVYGQRTGLSPVAVVLSTLFWTLLWGPIGLLLATPLTVCLVVLGKHIEGLSFINVLLGDEPPLLPEERFYQRLLAGDAPDAADQAEDQLKTMSLSAYYDSVAMKALVLAQSDAAAGKLSADRQATIRATLDEIIDDVSDYQDANPGDDSSGSDVEAAPLDKPSPGLDIAPRVLCVGSRSALDEAAAAMLVEILEKRGVPANLQAFAAAGAGQLSKLEAPDSKLICVSYFGTSTKPAHVRYLIRRLKRLMPHARFVACFWMLGEERAKREEWRMSVGAEFVASSLDEAATICGRESHGWEGKGWPGRRALGDEETLGRRDRSTWRAECCRAPVRKLRPATCDSPSPISPRCWPLSSSVALPAATRCAGSLRALCKSRELG